MVRAFDRWRGSPPRFPVRVPAVSEPLAADTPPEAGEVQNLSQRGMLLRLAKALGPGVPLRVTLRLHQRPPLTLVGTVIWTRPHPDLPGWALGIQFGEDLPGEMEVEIADEEYPPWERRPREGPAEQAFGTVG
ncbi:MAG: PilZ domain-containing protein [candidate division NC10 bacterium]|nr:PilZ domain-containing protein [candidate division NC10 bacterium]